MNIFIQYTFVLNREFYEINNYIQIWILDVLFFAFGVMPIEIVNNIRNYIHNKRLKFKIISILQENKIERRGEKQKRNKLCWVRPIETWENLRVLFIFFSFLLFLSHLSAVSNFCSARHVLCCVNVCLSEKFDLNS